MSADAPARANPSTGSSFRIRRILQKWPLLIWLAALFGVVYMYKQRGTFGRVNGMVFANLEEVAPSEDGIISSVHVRDGERVKKGQPLVTLDPSLINQEIEQLEAELVLERLERTSDFQAQLTRIEDMLNNVEQDKVRDEKLLEVAQEKLKAAEAGLRATTTVNDVQIATIERDTAKAKVGNYANRIASLKTSRGKAQDLINKLNDAQSDDNSGEEPKALKVLKERLKNKTLNAPADGTIQKVHKLRGVARLGEPVLTFIPDRDDGTRPAKMVRGFVQQKEDPETLEVDGFIWISERVKNPVAYQAKIISVAPDITAIQNYGTPVPGQFLRGREFLCELPSDLAHLLPGTAVHIHRTEPGSFNIWNFGKAPVKAASN